VSVKRERDKVKGRSVREIIWCVLRTGEIATPDFIRLAMTGVFSGCLKSKISPSLRSLRKQTVAIS
ncbi:MAG: hypothetical protein IJR44_00140, partial [Neisseriaceae bacterium]|nr:hypothetical protein [Neisseriaceae bacterium]